MHGNYTKKQIQIKKNRKAPKKRKQRNKSEVNQQNIKKTSSTKKENNLHTLVTNIRTQAVQMITKFLSFQVLVSSKQSTTTTKKFNLISKFHRIALDRFCLLYHAAVKFLMNLTEYVE